MADWVDVCSLEELDPEDVIRFDHDDRTFAVYRAEDGSPHATEGLCTHEKVHLCDGLVLGDEIECPKHNGRFNIRTGAAQRAPVTVDLRTFPARIREGRIEIEI
ncbi:MocE family 2Fe-2S type ferredoxin [Histidinibacterium lentulum]|uniref:Rieske family ferredoxin n=1 Tax=Histidinibacterium lentulum TaxID=2480588 RepID=A0A3N2QY91_9RHOB|nr:MocE family 2Fe-2S type ferredoxin [Histidinibacterium lentulum]ROU00161.1 Rieske family ferredoxin [Histidinibacterium lentulum]